MFGAGIKIGKWVAASPRSNLKGLSCTPTKAMIELPLSPLMEATLIYYTLKKARPWVRDLQGRRARKKGESLGENGVPFKEPPDTPSHESVAEC